MSELLDIVKACENQLGWLPHDDPNPYRARAIAAVRLERALARHPDVTTADLRLAIAYCRQRRQPITSPSYLLRHVDDAKAHGAVRESPSALAEKVNAAMNWEMDRRDDDSADWIGRLVRSEGAARVDVLREWNEAGRG